MGLAVDKEQFDKSDFELYRLRLNENVAALRSMLSDPQFALGPQTIGAELELSMVDAHGLALPLNQEVLAACNNENTQVELNNFNLEYNFTPAYLAGEPFANLENQINFAMQSLDSFAADVDGRVVGVGILPTLRQRDLTPEAVTNLPRYHALATGLRRLKGTAFCIDINGIESLKLKCDSIALEGANTSFQLHLRVNPDNFANTFNAAQFVTPLVQACAANSPIFLDKLLWDETRVALFKQSIDTRHIKGNDWRQAARVPFGHGWVRHGIAELFEEAVALHPPLLPIVDGERPLAKLAAGEIPALRELRALQGTIWQWNRPVYDPAAGGHLRIELRSLPAGPTAIDMAANAAFFFGLVLYYRDRINTLLPCMPFAYAEYNFYRAAQSGLDAVLLWPGTQFPSPTEVGVRSLIEKQLPNAIEGLVSNGVDSAEAERLMQVIANRNDIGVTGARWLRSRVLSASKSANRRVVLAQTLNDYIHLQNEGEPVATWPLSE